MSRPRARIVRARSVAAICYDVEPVDGPVRVVVQSELVANESLPAPSAIPGSRPCSRRPCVGMARGRANGSGWSTDQGQRPAGGGVDGSHDRRPRATQVTGGELPGLGPGDGDRCARARAAAADREVRRLRLVRAAIAARRCATRWRGAAGRRAGRLGGPAGRAAGLPGRLLGPGRRRDRGRPRAPTGRAVRAVPRPPGRCPRRAPGIAAKG